MLSSNTSFDGYHALSAKTPMYLIHFDGEAEDYANHTPGSPSNTVKEYLCKISGLEQKVTPEEGTASIGGLKVELLDYNNEITALLATDTYFFHRKKMTVKAGYLGLTEANMIAIFTGWVTDYDLSKDGLSYVFDVTDPKKWMQRKVFRGAETSTVTISGNPINILLAVLTSTGAGTNGDYDWYAAENGLGLDVSYINVAAIEAIRDNWFPGDSHYMRFTISKRIKAKEFVETEILKPLNCYPIIDGQGRFNIKAFRPPLAAIETVQTFSEDNIIDLPQWSANLDSVVNEVECFYDYDPTDNEFDGEQYFIEGTSLNNRGPGKKPISIKSKGFHTSNAPGSINGRATDIMITRKTRIFGRFATPPISIKCKTFFSRWLSEAGDVVPLTHARLPELVAGSRGLSAERMEIINRSVDWQRGLVTFDMLNTGFNKGIYGVIAPCMTVTVGTSATQFTVSTADAAKFAVFTTPEIQICDSKGRVKVAAKTLLTVNTGTGVCTCDNLGFTPAVGDVVRFANYDSVTSQQKLWDWVADSSDNLGAGDDDAHLIVP